MNNANLSALTRTLLDACAAHEAAHGDEPSPTWEAVKAAANDLNDAIVLPEDDDGDYSVQSDGPVLN